MTAAAKQRRQNRLIALRRELLADHAGDRMAAAVHYNGLCECQRNEDRPSRLRRFVARRLS